MGDSLALYRKYRGTGFKDIIGQEHITKPLENSIKAGRVSHAYLFTGPHGVGKTSVARIVAHSINDLDYEAGGTNLDIVEIDAASNRRIDEVRDLREKVHIAPVSAKYKVYIIDEVHMLTPEAFNALLKTLEEPPGHVVFILATTEAHKLPTTIISRTQRHSFKPIEEADAIARLKEISKKESIKIEDEAIELIAEHGEGSFRDSLGLLDQVSNLGAQKISKSDVESMLGLAKKEQIDSLRKAASQGDMKQVLKILEDFHEKGVSAPTTASQLIGSLRQQQRYTRDFSPQTAEFIDDLIAVAASRRPEIKLEITLLRYASNFTGAASADARDTEADPEVSPDQPKQTAAEVKQEKDASQPAAAATMAYLDDSDWQIILQAIKKKNNALYAVMRMAKARFDGSENINLEFRFQFHKNRANEDRNRMLIIDMLKQHLELDKINLEYTVAKDKAESPAAKPEDMAAKSVIDAFGGGEVVNL